MIYTYLLYFRSCYGKCNKYQVLFAINNIRYALWGTCLIVSVYLYMCRGEDIPPRAHKGSRWWPRYGPVTLLANICGLESLPPRAKLAVQENGFDDTSILRSIIWRRAGPRLENGAVSSGSLRFWMLPRTTAMSQLESWSDTWHGLREQMRLC